MAGPAKPHLCALRDRIQALESGGRPARFLPLAAPALAAALPGGGLALGALHEIIGAGPDEEDGAIAAAFAAALLARIARHAAGEILWCLAAADLYGPGLAAQGLAPSRLVLARCRDDDEMLWAMEEGLRSPSLAAVLGEIGTLPLVAGRRLQLAAEAGGVTAVLLRRWRDAATAARQRATPSAAVTRWRVAAAPSQDTGEPGVGAPLWRVELLRCRGGSPGSWILSETLMEAKDATGDVAVSAGLAGRSAARRLARA